MCGCEFEVCSFPFCHASLPSSSPSSSVLSFNINQLSRSSRSKVHSMSSDNEINDHDEDWLSEVPAISSALSLASSNQEWSTLHERFTNVGYKQGISSGKLSTIQTGFDQGFAQSMPSARKLGFMRGFASSLLDSLCSPTSFRALMMSSDSTSDMSSSDREYAVGELRELLHDLSRARMSEVVPKDVQAEEHARLHGGEKEWEIHGDKGEMDGLEGLMDGLGGRTGGARKVDLVELNARLGRLMTRCKLPSTESGRSDMAM